MVQSDLPKLDYTGWQPSMKEFAKALVDRLALTAKLVEMRQASYNFRMKNFHDKNVLPDLNVGDKVLRFIPAKQRAKLDFMYDGPWTVIEHRERDGAKLPVYIIRHESGDTVST